MSIRNSKWHNTMVKVFMLPRKSSKLIWSSSSYLISDVIGVGYMNFGSPCNTVFAMIINYFKKNVFLYGLNLSFQMSTLPSAPHINFISWHMTYILIGTLDSLVITWTYHVICLYSMNIPCYLSFFNHNLCRCYIWSSLTFLFLILSFIMSFATRPS